MKKNRAAVISNKMQETAYAEYVRVYHDCFYNVLTTIHLYHKIGLSLSDTIRSIKGIMEGAEIGDFSPDDWDIIISLFSMYSWEKI